MTDSEIIKAENILRSSEHYSEGEIKQAKETVVKAIVEDGYILANFHRLDDFDEEEG